MGRLSLLGVEGNRIQNAESLLSMNNTEICLTTVSHVKKQL